MNVTKLNNNRYIDLGKNKDNFREVRQVAVQLDCLPVISSAYLLISHHHTPK